MKLGTYVYSEIIMVDIVKKEEQADPKKPPSDGVTVFNRALYTGVGFGVNEASSLWITNQFANGNNLFAKVPALEKAGEWFSKSGYERVGAWIAKTFKFADKVSVEGKKISSVERGKNALLMTTLISGGTLLILPMKWLEDSKAYWVHKTDHVLDWMRGNKMSAEEIAKRDEAVEQYIACSPRQSWSSMLIGRTIAVLSSIGLGTFIVGPKNNDRLMDWSEKTLTGKLLPKDHIGKPHSWRNYARLLSVETYSCATSSIVLEIMSKFFSKKSSKPHDPELCHAIHNAAPTTNDSAAEDKPANAAPAKSYRTQIQAQKDQASQQQLAFS